MDADGDQDLVFSNNVGLVWAKNQGSDGFLEQGSLTSY